MESDVPVRLFVYGSLKRGFAHHGELRGARFERAAATASGYCLFEHAGYPALVFEGGAERVFGEVFWVARALLPALDTFEDCPRVYQRSSVTLDDGSVTEAYTMDAAALTGAPRLASGVWTEKSPLG